jgi:hypothetical protein
MSSFYRATAEHFVSESEEHILAKLAVAYANRGFTRQYSDQTLTWNRDIRSLKESLGECIRRLDSAKKWGVLLEFSIPRKERRIDAVLLILDTVVIVEAKTGDAGQAARRQIEEYGLLLHYFHKASAERKIVPIVVSQSQDRPVVRLKPREVMPQAPGYWVREIVTTSWRDLSEFLLNVADSSTNQLSVDGWDESPYYPVPTIIDAALALKSGLSIREVAHSEASEHEIGHVRETIQTYVDDARAAGRHTICFLTGVPGSGKTLVGLSLAHSDENRNEAIHFMSGNGPLVKVLQHLFTQESMSKGRRAPQARAEAKTLIENVHVFARYHTEDNQGPPSNHAIIFDEAQRAWNRAQNWKKFRRDFSEPEMLLRIMERQDDWAFVVALVGGGQEINDGEAGLEEWGRALMGASRDWTVYASPEVLQGGPSTAGHKLFDIPVWNDKVRTVSELHLRTSNRSLRAEQLAIWVNLVLDGEADRAASLKVPERFPILLTRNLDQTRSKLDSLAIGQSRFGLVGSSGAMRLRAEGLEPSSTFHAEYPWYYWYLAERGDIRSSYRCEVFATEFEIQGLELDWIGVCWGGDFVWSETDGWQLRTLRHGAQTKWAAIANAEKRVYRRNAYRVLLTRARQGMIIFVPRGGDHDPTNRSKEFDATAGYLLRCGVTALEDS